MQTINQYLFAGLVALVLLSFNSGTAVAQEASIPEPAFGDPSQTAGFFAHVRFGGYGVAFKNNSDGSGNGMGFRLGYGFNDRVTIFLGAEMSRIDGEVTFEGLPQGDKFHFGFIELGSRYHFRPKRRFIPYAEGAISVIGLAYDGDERVNNKDVTYGGLGVSVAGGVMYYLKPSLAIEGNATFTPGSLMSQEISGNEVDYDMGLAGVRLNVGFSWYPFR